MNSPFSQAVRVFCELSAGAGCLHMHIHLDPLGGIAGDMFVAAVLDAWPELGAEIPLLLAKAGLPPTVTVAVRQESTTVFAGTRFLVAREEADEQGHDHHHQHDHRRFRDIRARLESSGQPAAVVARAVDIFSHLAEAEGKVHGRPAEEVTFHEVGAWDSIADIVSAAYLIEYLDATWSVAPLPVGSGTVETAHGTLPVPAPATVLLLEGFPMHDDGVAGERVTPTGAAILRHLQPSFRLPELPLIMSRTGIGLGARQYPGLNNILRLVAYQEATPATGVESAVGGEGVAAMATPRAAKIAVLSFEVDDQTPEDLAVGLDNLRALPAVVDVLQTPAFGKKGRLTARVQVLARPEEVADVALRCLEETSTLGVRWCVTDRFCLPRQTLEIAAADESVPVRSKGENIRVKVVRRPSGAVTGKAEIEDVARAEGGYAVRRQARRAAETAVTEGRASEAQTGDRSTAAGGKDDPDE